MKCVLKIFSLLSCLVGFLTAAEEWSPRLALDYLEKVQLRPVVELDDYAVSGSMSDDRRDWLQEGLASNLTRLINFQNRSKCTFELLDSRQKGDLGIVLVTIQDSYDPLYVDVLPMAFCLVDGHWKLTPLPGQFAMTGYGVFDPEAYTVREELETWASKRRIEYVNSEVSKRQNDLDSKVETLRQQPPLKGGSKEDVAEYFIQNCRERNLAGVLASTGYNLKRSRHYISRYRKRSILYSVIEGLRGGKNAQSWLRLLGHNYLFTILPEIEGEEKMVSVGGIFPSESTVNQIIELDVQQQGKLWQVTLPDEMYLGEDGEFRTHRYSTWRLKDKNEQRLDKVRSYVLADMEQHKSKNIKDALAYMLEGLNEINIEKWCYFTDWSSSNPAATDELKSEEIVARFNESLALWTRLRRMGSVRHRQLNIDSDEAAAIVTLMSVPRTKPQNYKVNHLVFSHSEDGVLFLPDVRAEAKKQTLGLLSKNLIKRHEGFVKDLSKHARELLVGKLTLHTGADLKGFSATNKANLLLLCAKYEGALKDGDVAAATAFVSCVKSDEKLAMSSLGADLRGRIDPQSRYAFEDAYLGKNLAAYSVVLSHVNSQEQTYMLYFVINTPTGMKLLPHILYYYEHGRGEEILNNQMMKRMRKTYDAAFVTEALQLIESFNNEVIAKQ